ncbi:MAG: alpha/beta hydrolase family protein [Bryobacteraceae bacterium]
MFCPEWPFLKSRKEIDATRIGAIGHSEGGIVGPLAASRSRDLAFVVLLAGPGVPLDQVLYKQAELITRSAGASDAAIARNRQIQELVIGALKSEEDPKASAAKIREGWDKMKASLPSAEREQMDAVLNRQIQQFNTPEIRSTLRYDPAGTLRKLKIPVLAMNGSRDLQVSAQQNLPAIADALSAGDNPDFTVTELPGLNHLFQRCKQCTLAEYGSLEETFSPAALEILGNWISRHAH